MRVPLFNELSRCFAKKQTANTNRVWESTIGLPEQLDFWVIRRLHGFPSLAEFG
jgi:hypothetical protein